jgi:predicted phosphodiesterase
VPDRSLLGDAHVEFVVISDTHFMRVSGDEQVELESRRRQAARAAHAMHEAAAIGADFVVHLGDLVQAFPESPDFDVAMREALSQIAGCGLEPRYVAGNHDVGDKPDPTMPTDPPSPASLADYHQRIGPSWYSWGHVGYHFVVLNSQILNSGLAEEDTQWEWLANDLNATSSTSVVVFMHLAPYLVRSDEPARGRLGRLFKQHDVRVVFTGHSHWQFFNRAENTRLFVTPSTSFTRPGFSEIFSSSAPPDQGRDDAAKLGFFLVRGHDDGLRVHRIRTDGDEAMPSDGFRRVVTAVPADVPGSPLGVVARHPLTLLGGVPLAWPSLIRQPMRNDYPLLACLELGVQHLRIPGEDVLDAEQVERLRLLKDERVELTGVWIWSDGLDCEAIASASNGLLERIEFLLPSTMHPDGEWLEAIRRRLQLPVSVAPLIARETVPGKQHARARIGFRVHELADLSDHLDRIGAHLDRVPVRVDPAHRAWDVMQSVRPLSGIENIDWLIEFGTLDQRQQSIRVAEALFAASLQPGCRVFLDPLMDLDRTMDVTLGLLDRQSNPNPAFHVGRLLNTLLFSRGPLHYWETQAAGAIGLESATEQLLLVTSGAGADNWIDLEGVFGVEKPIRYYDLERARVKQVDMTHSSTVCDRPMLFVASSV